MRHNVSIIRIYVCVLTLSTLAAMTIPQHAAAQSAPEAINWDDLLPEGEMERIEELYQASFALNQSDHYGMPMTQIGTFNVVEELIGKTIRMPGYILPLDAQPGGTISEFLLVPYFGACVHTPPPPPNQIVHVVMSEPISVDRVWAPVWVTGILSSERHSNELGHAAYTLELIAHEPYQR
ncbi:MAG: DUF3299 domain-containing protein [Maricaulis sp.]|jgi:hypothetical protein|nr:DUF3299 domain-containing protein [Maricaulis sp.]MDG2045165.1 DUF3299 domain-containing protein [Maricaulis sp.]